MPHYIAIIEDAGPDEAVGVWFPDLPGCISGGDDVDEALENAPEALAFYAQELIAKSTGTTSAFAVGERVFHQKFGNGNVTAVDGNKLTIAFDKAGEKRVVDSFVERV